MFSFGGPNHIKAVIAYCCECFLLLLFDQKEKNLQKVVGRGVALSKNVELVREKYFLCCPFLEYLTIGESVIGIPTIYSQICSHVCSRIYISWIYPELSVGSRINIDKKFVSMLIVEFILISGQKY